MADAVSADAAAATQWLFTREDLQFTPSVTGVYDALLDASSSPNKHSAQTMTSEQERVLRGKGVHLIYKMGEFLQVGQHVMVAAATYFHRFFMRRPLQVHRAGSGWSHYEIAAACVFLACKSEESLRKLPFIVDAVMASLDKSPEGQMRWADRSFRSHHGSHEFAKWRDCILLHEEALLTTLCFDLVVPQPHEALVRATRAMEVEPALARLAWTILNDCMRDPVCLFFDAPVLAAGAFLKACCERHVDPAMYYAARPRDAPRIDAADAYFDWLDAFDVDEDEAREAMTAIDADVYDFHMPLQRPTVSKPAHTAGVHESPAESGAPPIGPLPSATPSDSASAPAAPSVSESDVPEPPPTNVT